MKMGFGRPMKQGKNLQSGKTAAEEFFGIGKRQRVG
jgi:hypothetical protein